MRLLPSRSRDLARVLALEMLGEPGPDGEIVALFCRWQVGKLAVPGGLRLSPQRHKVTKKSLKIADHDMSVRLCAPLCLCAFVVDAFA